RWQLGDGSQLRLELNLGEQGAPLPASSSAAQLLFASRTSDATPDQLPPRMAKLYLEKAK
ncbi:DUF3459 domain-containing protein, partial [Klebsiella pneumoniae]